jgi:hypothetical protein
MACLVQPPSQVKAMENTEATNKIFVTCNSEYGVSGHRVVGVRPRGEKAWLPAHRALGMRVVSDLSAVTVGDCLHLAGGNDSLMTSRVVDVRRGPSLSAAA